MLRLIKSKKDAAHFLGVLEKYAQWDGLKYFIQLPGITLMKYQDGRCTFHRKNELFEDIKEHELNSSFLYKYRKETNAFIKGIK